MIHSILIWKKIYLFLFSFIHTLYWQKRDINKSKKNLFLSLKNKYTWKSICTDRRYPSSTESLVSRWIFIISDQRWMEKKKKRKRSIYRCIIAVNNRPIVPILNRLVHRGKYFVFSVLKITRGIRSGKPRADARLFRDQRWPTLIDSV